MPDLAVSITSIPLPLAHAGHWAVWILYAVPILAVLATIAVSSRREGKRDPPDGAGASELEGAGAVDAGERASSGEPKVEE